MRAVVPYVTHFLLLIIDTETWEVVARRIVNVKVHPDYL